MSDSLVSNAQKILFAGDIDSAFSQPSLLERQDYQVCTNFLDAIDAAAQNRYRLIVVAMSDSVSRTASVFKALKKVNPGAEIILLARMYQEPAAIELLGHNGSAAADDYLICPLTVNDLTEYLQQKKTEKPATAARIRQLEKLATEDGLTGLKNRRYIMAFAEQVIDRAERTAAPVTVLIFDIDNFKHYNDVYGHAAGDKILKQAALLMRNSCRSHDVVGRIGGDEFAVIFWDNSNKRISKTGSERRSGPAEHPGEAVFIAKRFRKELNKAELNLLGPEGKGVLTISGALASFPRDGSTVEQLFRKADMALLEAKRNGKNKIYIVGKPTGDISGID